MPVTVKKSYIDALLLIVDRFTQTRPAVSVVHFEFRPNIVQLVATDGKKLLSIVDRVDHDIPKQNVSFHYRELDVLVKGRGADNKVELLPREDGLWEGMCGDRHIVIHPDSFTYPNWRNITPTQITNEVADYNPSLVAELQKAFNVARELKTSNHTHPLHIVPNGTGPGICTVTDLEAVGMVMPYRDDSGVDHKEQCLQMIGSVTGIAVEAIEPPKAEPPKAICGPKNVSAPQTNVQEAQEGTGKPSDKENPKGEAKPKPMAGKTPTKATSKKQAA